MLSYANRQRHEQADQSPTRPSRSPFCESNSIRAVTRLGGITKTPVSKLVVDAGKARSRYQDRVFRNLERKRVQVDEIWGFVGTKAKNADPEAVGAIGFYEAQRKEVLMALESLRRALQADKQKPPTP
jgi:hypothetical protein